MAVLLAVGAVSWLFRVGAIALLPATRLPSAARRLLDHAGPPPSPRWWAPGSQAVSRCPTWRPGCRCLLGAAVTAALAWRRRGIVLPVAAGLAATWVLSGVLI